MSVTSPLIQRLGIFLLSLVCHFQSETLMSMEELIQFNTQIIYQGSRYLSTKENYRFTMHIHSLATLVNYIECCTKQVLFASLTAFRKRENTSSDISTCITRSDASSKAATTSSCFSLKKTFCKSAFSITGWALISEISSSITIISIFPFFCLFYYRFITT